MRIVLLHAFPLDERMWKAQQDALDGHEVIAPRLYGLGSSMDAWAAAILERIEGSFVACGASMGGYCALALARTAPARLTGLLLAGARVEADSPERRAGRADTIELIRSAGAEGLWREMRPKLFTHDSEPAVVERGHHIVLDQEPGELVAAVEAIRDRPDSSDVVAGLDVPVVVAVGEHDPFLSVDEARGIGGRLKVFHGVGHLPSLERPEEFTGLLTELAA